MTASQILAHPMTMLWLGQLLHLAQTMANRKAAGQPDKLLPFLRDQRWSITFAVVAGLVGYAIADSNGLLNPASAAGIGFAADSIVSGWLGRARARLEPPADYDKAGSDKQ